MARALTVKFLIYFLLNWLYSACKYNQYFTGEKMATTRQTPSRYTIAAFCDEFNLEKTALAHALGHSKQQINNYMNAASPHIVEYDPETSKVKLIKAARAEEIVSSCRMSAIL